MKDAKFYRTIGTVHHPNLDVLLEKLQQECPTIDFITEPRESSSGHPAKALLVSQATHHVGDAWRRAAQSLSEKALDLGLVFGIGPIS